jgi:hydrogenase/urease accessory protein HupE
MLLCVLVALGTWSGRAMAHPVGLSQGEYVYRRDKLYAGITFARRELSDALPWLRGTGEQASILAFEEHRDLLGQWLVERLSASVDQGACRGAFDGMRFDGDGVALALSYACPEAARHVDLDARFVAELERGHRHLATLSRGGDRFEDVATTAHPVVSFSISPDATAAAEEGSSPAKAHGIFAPLLRTGVEHILTGYDHLLFLLGLVLVGGPIRSLIGAITAFTVAHSITLGIAALGLWSPSPRLVEPAIALSIAYVGIENWFVRDGKGRWRVTFPFGLVHGFGFSGALRDIALPRPDVPIALMGFNLGVELGQMAVLAAIFPLVLLARKRASWERIGMRACTMTIALAGVVWFIARVQSSI